MRTKGIGISGWVSVAVSSALCLAAALGAAQAPAPGLDAALMAKANGGDAAAQVMVGESYQGGKGIPQDYALAVEWYRKAADKGDIAAEMHLAALYRDGGGKHFARDMVQAAAWYRKAADQGDVKAQGTLGVLYSMGQGVPRSSVEAYYWLDLAAAVKGPDQEKYAMNRQMVGQQLTTDDLETIQDREAQWKAAHPRAAATE